MECLQPVIVLLLLLLLGPLILLLLLLLMLQLLHEGLTQRKDIETKARLVLNGHLADIDWRLKQGCNERIQLAAVAGAFHKVRL